MNSNRNYLALFALLGLLAACASGDPRSSAPTGEQLAKQMADEGRHAEAASRYLALAGDARPSDRDRLTLLAVEQWLDAGDTQRAREFFSKVPKPASTGDALWLWSTNAATIHLTESQPDEALKILESMGSEPLSRRHRIRVERLRADAWFQKDDPARAVNIYLQRENYLESPLEFDHNLQLLWAGLLVSKPSSMRSAAQVASDPIAAGWLSLGALATSTGAQGLGWVNGMSRWQEAYPEHPATRVLADMPMPQQATFEYPRRVALLLPLSGRNSAAGKAVQNGFFGAYFSAVAELEEAQQVTVYDVDTGGVIAAYEQAAEDGAEFVVGPLLKRDVETLAEHPMLPVPVLALNYLPDDQVAPPAFYQFALAPEDEAAAAAERALMDGGVRGVVLYPSNDWGRRVANRFSTELEAAGGVLLDHADYQTSSQDFSLEIESLMGLTRSVARYNRMRANLGEALQFDPRRRQDIDFVFLAADGRIGRLIKSQLKFHYAGDLPVYSTSTIYAMDGRSNRDLNGVMFADTPWTISPPDALYGYVQMFTEFWPAERRMGRLHAMGFDAYNLVNTISTGVSGELMSGATGRLYLQDDGRLRRRLAWGRFEGGNVVSLPGPDSAPESSEAALESDGSSEPAEWRLLQLNP